MYWIAVLDVPVRGWLWLGLLLLFIYFGLVFAVSMWSAARLKCLPLIPVIWTSIEFLRGLTPELGFPWGSIGYALIPHLELVQFAEFAGLPGITFFVLLINSLLFHAVKKRRPASLVWAVSITAVVWFHGSLVLRDTGTSPDSTPTVKIAVVQPNVAPEIKQSGNLDYRLSLLKKLSRGAGNCDLIVWPESAIPGYLNFSSLESKVTRVVDIINVPVIMGGARLDMTLEPSRVFNSCFLVMPGKGITQTYDKIYLVPFGERLPFTETFPVLRKLEFGQGSFSKGTDYNVFDLGARAVRFASLVCFESIFSRVSRRFVNNGARFLVNMTDDCWFGRTPGPYQHAQQAILRAIEYRIPIARCANTGISYFVSKKGETEYVTDIFTQHVIVKKIQLRDSFTFYARWGDWFAWLCVILFFLIFNNRLVRAASVVKVSKRTED
jgi:apolipoprotein N-acyltransferase